MKTPLLKRQGGRATSRRDWRSGIAHEEPAGAAGRGAKEKVRRLQPRAGGRPKARAWPRPREAPPGPPCTLPASRRCLGLSGVCLRAEPLIMRHSLLLLGALGFALLHGQTLPSEQKQKVDHAVPARAPAKPRRPRRMLVSNLAMRDGHPWHGSSYDTIPAANYAIAQMGKRPAPTRQCSATMSRCSARTGSNSSTPSAF